MDALNLQHLVAVRTPYMALKDLKIVAPDTVRALAPVERPVGNELSYMDNAETGRHLAIVGSFACSLKNPLKEKCYYLARHAVYTNLIFGEPRQAVQYDEMVVEARCTQLEKREARATAFLLTPDGRQLARIDLSYAVLSAPMFEKLNQRNYVENPAFDLANPYAEDLLLDGFESDPGKRSARADLGQIQARYCAGHFNHYPALPVAMVIHYLYRGAIKLIEGQTGLENIKYEPCTAVIGADHLGFAGETLAADWQLVESGDQRFRVNCTATADATKVIGKLDLEVFVRDSPYASLFMESIEAKPSLSI